MTNQILNPIRYARKKTNCGTLKNPVYFYKACNKTPEPNSIDVELVYKCFCEIYKPSLKDIEIMNSHDVVEGITIIIRDTRSQFIPTHDHIVTVENSFYKDSKFKILDINPQDNFIKLILTTLGE